VDQQKLQEVMAELAAYCSNYQGSLSAGGKCRPAPGAACCAQFSGEKNTSFFLHYERPGSKMNPFSSIT